MILIPNCNLYDTPVVAPGMEPLAESIPGTPALLRRDQARRESTRGSVSR